MKHDPHERTNAASGCASNDGEAILAAVREQQRWGVMPPVLNEAGTKCVLRPWNGAEEIDRKRRGR